MFWIVVAAVPAVLVAVIAFANRFSDPPRLAKATLRGTADGQVTDKVTVMTWNIGYAGMGQDSDFFLDKGQQYRPPDPTMIDENLAAICAVLPQHDADVVMIQEAARPSWLTYGRDVMAGVSKALRGYVWMFGAEARTRLMPPSWRISVGNALLTRLAGASGERRALPLEPNRKLGIFRKGYRMHILRVGDWVFVNIHLSTFDTLQDDVRRAQVIALLEFAQSEFADGKHVVIGGDWNLRLADTHFPHQTAEEFQFWIRDFPQDLRPQGWTWAVDATVPTVRTAHQPYVAGDNLVLTIDGFLVSPNVAVDRVSGIDLGFVHTDHHPVVATFSARP